MMPNIGKYRVFKTEEGTFIEVFVSDIGVNELQKVSAVEFDSEGVLIHTEGTFRKVKVGKLYSYQRLVEERKKYHDRGYEEGYNLGYAHGFSDGKLEGYEEGYKAGLAKGQEKERHKARYEEWRKMADEDHRKRYKVGTVKGKEGRKRAVTEGIKQQILAMHTSGKSYRQIESTLGVSRTTVGKVVKGEY